MLNLTSLSFKLMMIYMLLNSNWGIRIISI